MTTVTGLTAAKTLELTGALDSRLDTVETDVAAIPPLDTRLDVVEAAIPPLDTRLDVIEAAIPPLDTRLDVVEAAIPPLDTRLDVVEAALPGLALPSRLNAVPSLAGNLNTVLESGWVRTDAATTNKPSTGNHVVQTVAYSASNDIVQIATDYALEYKWYRTRSGGTWGNWILDTPVKFVSALPTGVDGLEVLYQNADMATRGEVWRLRYRAAAPGSYKWDFVGGAPMHVEVAAAEGTSSTSYAALATALALTLPLAGDYDIEVQATIENGTNNSWASYIIGAAAASDADAAMCADGGRTGVIKTSRKTGLAAAASVAARYKVGSGTGIFRDRRLRATPVRVG